VTSKGADQTIGFDYIMTLLLGDCRGPVDEFLAIEVDDKIAWQGGVSDDSPTAVNNPDLFGGHDGQGGIQGAFRLLQGAPDQILPGAVDVIVGYSGPVPTVTIPDIKASIGGRVSEFRGFVSILWRGLVASFNPYPKEWHLYRRRTTAGWYNDDCWYPAKATIWVGDGTIGAMNPAHIIYQVLTDPEWGASRSTSEIDENSFILAANTLCSEGFGLCLNWARQEDVDTFLQSIIDHIAGALYTDRTTGKIVLKLIRDDYDPSTVPLYDYDSGLLEIEEDDSASSDEMINEIIVKGKDQSLEGRGEDFEVRVHNNAARQSQGAIADTLELPGLPTRDLATRRGQMELKIHAPGLKRFKLKFDRRAWAITPAGVIRISAPSHNIANMVLRLGDEIDYGNTTDGTITASAIEDVFGLPSVSFQASGGSTWTPPDQSPQIARVRKLIEGGYRDTLRQLGRTDMAQLTSTAAYIGQMAKAPGSAYQYDLLSKTTSESSFVDRATSAFTEGLSLTNSITPLATGIVVDDLGNVDSSFIGEAFMCENEVMELTALNTSTKTLTVTRGCVDTIPATHAAGTIIWALDDDLTSDGREYASGEVVQTKVLTRTSSGLLSEAITPTDSVTLVARQYKPYPPGNVKIDSTSIFSLTGVHIVPVLTWAHRDRLTEDDQLVGHTAASIGPEAGTTYTVQVKSADGTTTLRTVTGLTGTTWTYTDALQLADGFPQSVLIQLWSVRGGVASWQTYSFAVNLGSKGVGSATGTGSAAAANGSVTIATGSATGSGTATGISPIPPQSTQWRVYCTATQVAGSWFSLAEIEMRASVGGADQCTGGTASASGTGNSNGPANGFDNSNATIWQSGNGTMPQWIQYTFASLVSVEELMLRSTSSAGDSPKDFQLQYFDGAAWQTYMTVTGTLWNASQSRTFPAPGNKVATDNWRLNVTAVQNSGSFASIAEIALRSTSGGANQATGGTAFAQSVNTSQGTIAGAFDGNNATKWQASNGTLPQWIGYALTSDLSIVEVAITAPATNVGDTPTAITVQRHNGSTWEDVWNFTTPATWTANEQRVFTKP
jgi:hypothetical protein